MNRIVKLLVVIILTAPVFSIAQTDAESIKNDFSEYLQAITSKDYEKSMDYMVEDVFDIVPRDQMVSMMEATMNTKEIEFKFGDFNITAIQDPVVIDTKSYIILNYVSEMSMKFLNQEDEKPSEEDIKTQNMLIASALKQQFGKENVVLDETSGFFNINAIKKAVAVKKENETRWKFLVVEKAQPFLLKSILPASILEKALTDD